MRSTLCKLAKEQSMSLGIYSWSKNCDLSWVQFMLAIGCKALIALNAFFSARVLLFFCPQA